MSAAGGRGLIAAGLFFQGGIPQGFGDVVLHEHSRPVFDLTGDSGNGPDLFIN